MISITSIPSTNLLSQRWACQKEIISEQTHAWILSDDKIYYICTHSPMARKLQKQDVQYIEKLRTALNEESELSTNIPEDNSTFDQIFLDQFHTQILRLCPTLVLKIKNTEAIAKTRDFKEHTLYLITISTNQINYQVKRRYSQFYNLYKKIKKFLPMSSSFPKKNYNPFVSSTSQVIIQQRCSKLNEFMQSVLILAMSSKEPLVSLCFCNFIELKENYKNHLSFMNQYNTSFQQKIIYNKANKVNTLKASFSHRSFNKLNENSIEMLIMGLGQKFNTGKHLEKLGQLIKNKKQKATNDQIKLIFMGYEQYQGLLHFGLNNCLESNRIIALQMLLDLITPQNNFHFQKFQKIVQKIPIDIWVVKNITYLQNSTFKILYFRLLRIYCQRMEKEMHFNQDKILKKLFLFHEDLITHYLQFKKLSNHHYYTSSFHQHTQSKIERSQQIEVLDFEQEQTSSQLIHYLHKEVEIYYVNAKNILVLKLQSKKSVDQIRKLCYKWNRTVQGYTKEQYTGLYRYKLAYKDKFWSLRMKIEVQSIKIDQSKKIELKLIPEELQKQFSNSIQHSVLKIYKRQQPFQICPQYEEQIFIKHKQHTCEILLGLKVVRDIDIFEGSLQKLANVLAEDARNIF